MGQCGNSTKETNLVVIEKSMGDDSQRAKKKRKEKDS